MPPSQILPYFAKAIRDRSPVAQNENDLFAFEKQSIRLQFKKPHPKMDMDDEAKTKKNTLKRVFDC